MEANPEIFKAYDIRGKVPEEINAEVGYLVGRAFPELLRRRYGISVPRIILSRDVRLSSPEIANRTLSGLLDGGAEVIDAGITTTPMHYWIVGRDQADGGIMVTASHNPKEYNGFKLSGRGVEPLGAENGFDELKRLITEGMTRIGERGNVIERDHLRDYISFLTGHDFVFAPLKVVVDASSGSAGRALEKIFEHYSSLKIIPLGFRPDGHFPDHDPNPLKVEVINQLAAVVREEQADLGVIFDGDGDRMVCLDERGHHIRGDILIALIASRILTKWPGETVVWGIPSSRAVREIIQERGGQAIAAKEGHFFIKRAMRDANAIFGGEYSGHYYFRETFFAENAMLAMLYVIELRSRGQRPLSQIVSPFVRSVLSEELNFPFPGPGAWDEFENKVARTFPEAGSDRTDGLTLETKEWRFNLRPSNTEPLLRLNAEAHNAATLQRLIDQLSSLIQSAYH